MEHEVELEHVVRDRNGEDVTYRHPQLAEIERVARARRKMSREQLDLDVEAFVLQVKALPVFQDCPRSIARTRIVMIHGAFGRGGRAHGNKRALIRISPATPIWWLLETIVHELVHCALPDRTVHNERFRLTLARAIRELWGFEVDPNPKPASGRGRAPKYRLDEIIEQTLECEIREGRITYPRRLPEPAEAVEARKAAERSDRAARRATHASKMLARAETRLKRAETIAKKWRAKVKRYERGVIQ